MSKWSSILLMVVAISLFSFLSIIVFQIQETRREFARQGLQYKAIEVPTYAYSNWVK